MYKSHTYMRASLIVAYSRRLHIHTSTLGCRASKARREILVVTAPEKLTSRCGQESQRRSTCSLRVYIYTEPEATFERAGAQSPNSILTSEKRERGIGVEEIEAFRARVVVVVANYGSSYIYVNGIRVYVYAAR